ncbi:MAG: hypothetical protein ABIV94_03140, partial [Acidimicrobiales bacterium]
PPEPVQRRQVGVAAELGAQHAVPESCELRVRRRASFAAVVAVLALRAMGEWHTIQSRDEGAPKRRGT